MDEDGTRVSIGRFSVGFGFTATEGAGNFAFILGERSPGAAPRLHSTQAMFRMPAIWSGRQPDEASYAQLATVLAKAVTHDGRVEIQWTDDPESASQPVGSRGHIEGPALFNAVQATGREVSVEEIAPKLDCGYSVKPSTRKSGADPAKNHVPTRPVPKFRWIVTFK